MDKKWTPKYQEGGSPYLSLIPLYDTSKSAIEFYKEPSWKNAAYVAGNALMDALTLTGWGYLAKGAKAGRAAYKLAKVQKAARPLREGLRAVPKGTKVSAALEPIAPITIALTPEDD